MIVIRRMVDRHRAYTAIFLPGEPAQVFPTTDFEHGRILQIYKQDKAYEGIVNDFTDDASCPSPATKVTPPAAETPSANPRKKRQARSQHRKTRQ
ncbi:MAG: hypothetical protein ABW223_04360 [Rariglobus sp.]